MCYAWNNVSLSPQDPPAPDDAEPIPAPSAEIQTIRLALILLTGQWIDPTSEMTPQMAAVTKAYQASRGLDVDGVIGRQTTDALAADLGCPANTSFRMIVPPELGPRRYATPRALLDDVTRFARTGRSTDPSLDTLLRAAGWDGANSLFLGCEPLRVTGRRAGVCVERNHAVAARRPRRRPGDGRRARLLGPLRPQCRPPA